MRKKITEREKEYMRNHVRKGDSVKGIAKNLGVSETTVYKYTQNTIKSSKISKSETFR